MFPVKIGWLGTLHLSVSRYIIFIVITLNNYLTVGAGLMEINTLHSAVLLLLNCGLKIKAGLLANLTCTVIPTLHQLYSGLPQTIGFPPSPQMNFTVDLLVN